MRVGIVLHPFGDSAKGLEQYIFETTCAILNESKEGIEFTIFVKGNPDVSGLPEGVKIVNLPNVFSWHLHLFVWYRKCDVFVFFTEVAPFFLWKKSIVVFFDAAYYYFGPSTSLARAQRRMLVWWRSLMLGKVRHVVAISEASKRDLVEKFSVPKEQISVIYPGFKTSQELELGNSIPSTKPFFMYVGPMKERKNVLRIVEAYIEFRRTTEHTHELYLVGRKSAGVYESEVLARIEASEYKDSIIFKTSVDDAGLYTLYKTTTALVYPSLLEGFGLPILEAMSVGCVVLTSSTTSTKEVLGTAGFLVDPTDIAEITTTLKTIAEGNYDREKLKKEAHNQCAHFSWEKSGEEWHQLFDTRAIQKMT